MSSISETNVTSTVKAKKLNQHIGGMIVSLGGFSLGVALGWNSSASNILMNFLDATTMQIGIVGSVLNVGACGGIITLPWLLKYFSRTSIMILAVPIALVGWAFICLADQQIWFLVAGRIFTGIANGIFCVLMPVYIGEVADKNTRVRILTYFQLFINFGIFYAFLVGYLLNERDGIWRYSLACAMSCVGMAGIIFLPESPEYHLKRGNLNAAVKSAKFYRGRNYNYQDDFDDINSILETKTSCTKIMKNRRVIHRIFMCHVVIITQQLNAVNSLIFYAVTVLNNFGSGDLTGSEQTLVVGIAQIISSLLCTILINALGRRILLTVSAALMGLFITLLGWYLKVRDDDPELYEDTYGWIPPACVVLYVAAFNIGLGPISWSLLGDVLPSAIKTVSATYMASVSWILSVIATLTLAMIIGPLGLPTTLWLFGGLSYIGSILCCIFVRETNGKSLAQIQRECRIDTGEASLDS